MRLYLPADLNEEHVLEAINHLRAPYRPPYGGERIRLVNRATERLGRYSHGALITHYVDRTTIETMSKTVSIDRTTAELHEAMGRFIQLLNVLGLLNPLIPRGPRSYPALLGQHPLAEADEQFTRLVRNWECIDARRFLSVKKATPMDDVLESVLSNLERLRPESLAVENIIFSSQLAAQRMAYSYAWRILAGPPLETITPGQTVESKWIPLSQRKVVR